MNDYVAIVYNEPIAEAGYWYLENNHITNKQAMALLQNANNCDIIFKIFPTSSRIGFWIYALPMVFKLEAKNYFCVFPNSLFLRFLYRIPTLRIGVKEYIKSHKELIMDPQGIAMIIGQDE